ncbi:MAG: hypothetical protein DMG53_04410 [Acidobacteria bacterium]|nr:MAG: hypothetical protein DMG53_04410 [Acidobacteriota bacterium]
MERRTAIRIVALGTLASKLDVVAAGMCHSTGAVGWSAGNYKLRFFTSEENELLDRLMEMIIPADSHSPGAHAAQVSLFADSMLATSSVAIQKQWREGLAIGIHQDLQYQGNTYLTAFPGCARHQIPANQAGEQREKAQQPRAPRHVSDEQGNELNKAAQDLKT